MCFKEQIKHFRAVWWGKVNGVCLRLDSFDVSGCRGHWRCCCHDSAAPVFCSFLGLLPVLLLLVLVCYRRCRCLGVPDCGAAVFVGYGIVMGLNSVGHLWISVSYLTLFSLISYYNVVAIHFLLCLCTSSTRYKKKFWLLKKITKFWLF